MDLNTKRPQFGARYLLDEDRVFEFNAWDDVQWDETQEQSAKEKIARNSTKFVENDVAENLQKNADKFWDQFYAQHNVGFFKDRNWLFTEFPELQKYRCQLQKNPQKYSAAEDSTSINPQNSAEDSVDRIPQNAKKIAGNLPVAEVSAENPQSAEDSAKNPQVAEDSIDRIPQNALNFAVNPRDAEDSAENPQDSENSVENPQVAVDSAKNPQSAEDSAKNPQVANDSVDRIPQNAQNFAVNPPVAEDSAENPQVAEDSAAQDPQIAEDSVTASSAKFSVLEVGCGVGNTVFPLLEANNHNDFFVYCCDFSSTAIDLLKKNESYDVTRCKAFVWDITEPLEDHVTFESRDDLAPNFLEENSLDVILMIFVLSAIEPSKMQAALNNVTKYLKPGGVLLFRDYGRYDLAQLRFKNGQCISDNFYVRGDRTRVYFFTQDELDRMFLKANLHKIENRLDRRLQVNRSKLLKMYRVWIQCKYVKKNCC